MSRVNSIWQNRRCLVTGAVGFIGSHLFKALREANAIVFAVDKEAAHTGTLFSLLNNHHIDQVLKLDLSESTAVPVISDLKVDVIFHLAALPYAPYTTQHQQEAYAANVLSTVNMLQIAQRSKIKKFVLASSACVFGASQHSPLHINDETYQPEHYYSITKRHAEKLVRAYNVPASICRLGNVYGPGDRHFGRIVPQMCTQLINRKSDVLELKRSTGRSVFEFLFVDDAVNALIRAAENNNDAVDTFQFSAGLRGRSSIVDLAHRISEIFDGRKRNVLVNNNNPEKQVEKYLDTSTAEQTLQWKAGWNLDDGLRTTMEWYKLHANSLTPHSDCEA